MSKAITAKTPKPVSAAQRKPPAIGTVNGAMCATLWLGNIIVGHCIDTRNSVAYGMRKTGADRSTSWLGTRLRGKGSLDAERIAAGGWLKSDAEALFSLP